MAQGEVDGACLNATSTMGIGSLAISADGHFLYATASSSDAVDVFARSATGALTQTGCLMNTPPAGPCTASPYIVSPTDIVLTADGTNAYLADAGRLIVASRAPATGALTPVSCIDNGASTSTSTTASDSSSSSSSSSDGGNDRNARSVVHTVVTQVAVASTPQAHAATASLPTCVEASGVDLVAALAVAPDGATVYAANGETGGLVSFARDPGSGALSEIACTASASLRMDGMAEAACVQGPDTTASHLLVSPDGRNVYELDSSSNAVYGYGPAATPTAAGARISRDGRAAIRVACPAVASGLCIGALQLTTLHPSRRSREAATVSSAATFRLSPGRSAVIHVRVPRAQRQKLRRAHGRVTVLAEVRPVPGGGGAAARVITLR